MAEFEGKYTIDPFESTRCLPAFDRTQKEMMTNMWPSEIRKHLGTEVGEDSFFATFILCLGPEPAIT